MKAVLRVLLLALPLLTCAGRGSVVAADPAPTPAELLKEYQALGLPLPPETAKLVRFERGAVVVFNGVLQPPSYGLAFQIKPGTKTEDPVFWNFNDLRPWRAPRVREEVKPDRDAIKDVELVPDNALTLAVQCQARGWTELAEALLERSEKGAKKTPKQRLVALGWSYWTNQAAHPTADRAPVAKRLKQLLAQHDELDTKDNRELLRSLELALVPGKVKPGSIEALIDALVDYHATQYTLSYKPGDAFRRIAERGFDAVPALIEHLTDDRLTRAVRDDRHIRVGDIAGDLLEGLAAEELWRATEGGKVDKGWRAREKGWRVQKVAAAEWWEKAQKRGEETYLLDHVLPPPGADPEKVGVDDHLIMVIAAKYPKQVPVLYRTVLDKRPEFQSGLLAEALGRCALPTKEKLDLFLYAARHKDYGHRFPALREIKKLDQKQFDTLLLATIEGFPKDVQGDYWPCNEAAIARLAIESNDPRVWPALEKMTKRAAIGLRMELLDCCGKCDDLRWRTERLRFLAAFLDDDEVRDIEADKRFKGSCAGFLYHQIEVRNFVAIELARLLEIEIERKIDRTPAEWSEVRQKVRAGLKRELGKPK